MARISTYDLDSKVTGGDKWIGTDSGSFNKTKNFTPIRLAEYFNSSEKIDSTNSLRFYYQIPEFEEERAVGTISFESFLGLSIPLSDLNYILLSKTTEGGIEVPDFLASLIDSKVLLHKGDSMNVYGIYEITSIEDYEINSNFFKISLSFIRGNGNLANGSSYLLSVIDFGLEQDITKHSELILDDGTNPHGTTKNDIGLSNVDNTSDLDKPISNDTQNALDLKANTSDLSTVAFSNDYNDLDNLPTIPSIDNLVPYTGATQNTNLGEFGLDTGFIKLDTTPTNTPTTQGTISWDVDDNTIKAVLNGYIMKIGEDQFYAVKNQTGSTINKGTAVRFAGTVGASGRLLIEPFIANGSVASTFFMGVTAENIANGADGKVLWFGRIRGINTNSFNEGDILYASTTVAGEFQTTQPQAPNNIVQVAAVITKSVNQGTIFVRPTIGSNINNDEGVKIENPVTGDVLQFQENGLWENKTLDSLGLVPESRTITINGETYDLSEDREFVIALDDLGDVVVTDSSGNVTLPKTLTIGEAPATTDDSLQVPTTSWVNDKLDTKVDKVAGKDLSTNDFTNDLKTKLDGIQDGAEVNVNADWSATSGDSLILNKPTIPSIEGLATEIYVDNGLATKQDTLGFTPENVANKATNLTSPDDTKYPTTLAVSTALSGKQDTLTNPITGTGASGQIPFFNGTTTQTSDSVFVWDNTNKRLGIGTTNPDSILQTVESTTGITQIHIRNSATGGSGTTRLKLSNGSDSNPFGFQIINNGTNGIVNIINYKNSDLALWTNTAERMRITSTGNVGIGATTAGARLDVRAQGALSTDIAFRVRNSADNNDLIRVQGNGNVGIGTTNPTARLTLSNSTETQFDITDTLGHSKRFFVRNSDKTLAIYNNDAGQLRTQFRLITGTGASNDRLSLLEAGGNVGIGITSPKANLHCNNSVFSGGASEGTEINGTNIYQSILAASGVSRGYRISSVSDSGYPGIRIDRTTTTFATSGLPSSGTYDFNLFRINGLTGNVGIGTESPSARLHVVGLPSYADNATAIAGGLTVGAFYHTGGILKVVI